MEKLGIYLQAERIVKERTYLQHFAGALARPTDQKVTGLSPVGVTRKEGDQKVLEAIGRPLLLSDEVVVAPPSSSRSEYLAGWSTLGHQRQT
ncbi:MAG: hypothetical protein IJL91_05480, partial [Bacteroidales bacterium]|nr:hypothetical protein [Bacteroidales bacterium]